jgi:hypothetical protein
MGHISAIPSRARVAPEGVPGRDGSNVLPTDTAVAALINDDDSDTRQALEDVVSEVAPTIPDATTSVKGKVELATTGETTTGTDTARATTPAGVAAALATIPSVLGSFIGQTSGQTTEPAELPPRWGVELWALANFLSGGSYNTSALAPSLTADAGNNVSRTLVKLGNLANQDLSFRVSFDIDSIPTNGWSEISILPVDSGGNIISGAVQQTVANESTASGTGLGIPVEFDFKAGAWAVGGTWLEIRLNTYSNASAGSLAISNVSVRQVAAPQRPMFFSVYPGLPIQLHTPLYDPVAGVWRMVTTAFSDDGALDRTPKDMTGYNTDRPFTVDPPDPDFLGPHLGVSTTPPLPVIALATGQVSRDLRAGNNDQIMTVKKADNSYELRGNVHGGETLRSGGANNKLEYDAHGNGTWATWAGTGTRIWPCRKFRFTFNTQLQRSDAGSPFANVDHLCTFFGDGMMRMDRTTTFLADQRVNQHFEWMSSHATSIPKVGRIGAGLIVLDEVDVFPKVATPAAPSNTGSTSGGTLAAGTRYYAVTALSEGGETKAGPTVSATNTGSTSSNALTWTAVSGATGYKVYRGASPTTLVHIATVAPGASPAYTDTNATATGSAPPPVNRARQLDAATTVFDSAVSDKASWAVWYDPILNMCFGNIYDRDSIAARAEVASVKVRLERGDGIMKNYLNTVMVPDGGNPDANADPGTPTRLIANGTVWTATHWAFTYVPADPVNYHLEIAARATDLSALKAAYPA